MTQYFYLDGKNRLGPFSLEEMKSQNLTRDTKVWYYGLDDWTNLSEVADLKEVFLSIPPELKVKDRVVIQNISESSKIEDETILRNKSPRKNGKTLKQVVGVILFLFIVIILFIFIKKHKKHTLYNEISSNAYNTDTDFQMYVDKFYRDVEFYGIYPKKPKVSIIKYSKLDQLDNATHLHAVSYGKFDDDRIEIYINPSTWDRFNKPLRYYLMYHELAHDVLNLDDLDDVAMNKGRLMYPAIESYSSITMDDFIDSSHALFEEVGAK